METQKQDTEKQTSLINVLNGLKQENRQKQRDIYRLSLNIGKYDSQEPESGQRQLFTRVPSEKKRMSNSCTMFYKYEESNYKKQKERKLRIFKENDPLLMKRRLQEIIGKQAETDYELEEE